MLFDTINISEGSEILNATIASGSTYPSNPSIGELFFRSDDPNEGLYVYDGAAWMLVGQGGTVNLDGLNVKPAVRVATTGNITRAGEQTIDGVVLVAGDRILVKNQSTASQNGIYVVSAGTWSRASDFDGSPANEVKSGDFVFVTEGTVNGDTGWVLTTNGTITIGTTALTFSQFTGANAVPGGSSGSVQYNSGSATFAGSSLFTWNNAGLTLSLGLTNDTAYVIGKDNSAASSHGTHLVIRGGNAIGTSATDGGDTRITAGQPGSAGAVSPGAAGQLYIEGAQGGANGVGATGGGNVYIIGGRAGGNSPPETGGNNDSHGFISFQTSPRFNGIYDRVERLRISRYGEWYVNGTRGNSGQVLTSNGVGGTPTWQTPSTSNPAGSTGQLQYNNAGSFAAVPSGSIGQVLTSAGVGVAPTWQDAAVASGPGEATKGVARAYLGSAANTTTVGWQKIPINTVQYDTYGIWSAGNTRFIPNQAGYYMVTVRIRTVSNGVIAVAIGKNGVQSQGVSGDFDSARAAGGSGIVYCNGTTDYLEGFIYTTTARAYTTGAFDTYMEVTGPINLSGQSVLLNEVNAFTKGQAVTPVALTDTATIAVDASLSNNFKVTLAGNRTLANPTNMLDGQVLNFRITQDATGNRTLSFGTKYKFAGGEVPALSTAAGSVDFLTCVYYADTDVLLCSLARSYA